MTMNPKQTRLTLGLSINEMAQVCGVHRQTWVKWERGERTPPAIAIRFFDILELLKTEYPDIFEKLKNDLS